MASLERLTARIRSTTVGSRIRLFGRNIPEGHCGSEGRSPVSNPADEIEFDIIEEGTESPYSDDPDEAQDDGKDPDA